MREVGGVMNDRRMPIEFKTKLYKTVARQVMAYEAECWALRGDWRCAYANNNFGCDAEG